MSTFVFALAPSGTRNIVTDAFGVFKRGSPPRVPDSRWKNRYGESYGSPLEVHGPCVGLLGTPGLHRVEVFQRALLSLAAVTHFKRHPLPSPSSALGLESVDASDRAGRSADIALLTYMPKTRQLEPWHEPGVVAE